MMFMSESGCRINQKMHKKRIFTGDAEPMDSSIGE